MEVLIYTIYTIIAIVLSLFAWLSYNNWKLNKYWNDNGVPHPSPWMLFRRAIQIFTLQITQAENFKDIFKEFPNEPYIGYYDLLAPALVVKDIEIIEKILIKDFMHFTDHGIHVDVTAAPFDSNLFLMTGKRWKAIRNRLSPMFTGGKMRSMFDTMKLSGDHLIKNIDDGKHEEVDLKDLLSRFSVDVIGSCAFGIDPGALVTPNNEFYKMARKTFKLNVTHFLKMVFVFGLTRIARYFNVSMNKRDVRQFFCNIIDDTVKFRRQNDVKRNDFVQMMMQLQDKGYVEIHTKDPDDDYLNLNETSYSTEKFEMSNEEITGHAFTFLTAGFDSISITIRYALYELSKHPQVQEKLREEIRAVTKQVGSLNYDALREMTYLEQCVKETLRKYSPSQILMRACTKEYTLPGGLVIKPGQRIYIATNTVHYNPNIYPDPERFQPERFDPDRVIPNCAFLPFGNGPRVCIAMRFSMMEIKYCLAKLFLNYSFRINSKTKQPLTLNPKSLFTEPKEQIFFNINKIIYNH